MKPENDVIPPGWYWVGYGAVVLVWAVLIWIHFYCFNLPTNDSWFYLAPAVEAEYPGDLHLALLVPGFYGEEAVWGLHWPGGLVAYSLFTTLITKNIAAIFVWVISAWLLLGVLCAWLVYAVTRNLYMASGACLSVLFSRWFFGTNSCFRFEMPASFYVLLSVLVIMEAIYRNRWSIWHSLGLGVLVMAGAFTHPSLVLFWAGCFAVLLLALFFGWAKQRAWLRPVPQMGAIAAGGIFFALMFWAWFSQPQAWEMFLAHLQHIRDRTNLPWPLESGPILSWRTYPSSGLEMPFVIFAGTGFAIYFVVQKWRSGLAYCSKTFQGEEDTNEREDLLAVLSIMTGISFGVVFAMTNPFHTVVFLPLYIALTWIGIARIWQSEMLPRLVVSAAAVLLLLASLAHLGSRTLKWYQAGMPNFRAELAEIYDTFPANKTKIIPREFWEEALRRHDEYAKIFFFPSSHPREILDTYYAQAADMEFEPGTIFVEYGYEFSPMGGELPTLDELMANEDYQKLLERFTETDRFEHGVRGSRKLWGYEWVIYTNQPEE
ncbi:MAG: hypothetical protein AAGK14_07275 [Verrucomicrobiota bacterium]